MKQSQLFTKTRKEAPKDEVSRNAQLLIRAGFIHKNMAGVYSLLPLGLRVCNNIVDVIRREMIELGGQEVSLSALQEQGVWSATDRWSDDVVDNWFKTSLKNGAELGLATTHEEPLTHLLKDHISSYKDLPVLIFQFQTKFRNELRAKSGIMRGREFLMKDLYSFSTSEEDHAEIYERVRKAYHQIFQGVGLGEYTYQTYASGGSFSQFSLEFQTVTDSGEDTIYVDEDKKIAINEEILTDEVCKELGVVRDTLIQKKSVEVGNIFNLGTKFSAPLELAYTDESGQRWPAVMGCYGIGIGRVMGTVAEVLSDEAGLIWPESIAPFDVHILLLTADHLESAQRAVRIYKQLLEAGYSVLIDDRRASVGQKFADADLIGIPYQIIIGAKQEDGRVEIKYRTTGERFSVPEDVIEEYIQ